MPQVEWGSDFGLIIHLFVFYNPPIFFLSSVSKGWACAIGRYRKGLQEAKARQGFPPNNSLGMKRKKIYPVNHWLYLWLVIGWCRKGERIARSRRGSPSDRTPLLAQRTARRPRARTLWCWSKRPRAKQSDPLKTNRWIAYYCLYISKERVIIITLFIFFSDCFEEFIAEAKEDES